MKTLSGTQDPLWAMASPFHHACRWSEMGRIYPGYREAGFSDLFFMKGRKNKSLRAVTRVWGHAIAVHLLKIKPIPLETL